MHTNIFFARTLFFKSRLFARTQSICGACVYAREYYNEDDESERFFFLTKKSEEEEKDAVEWIFASCKSSEKMQKKAMHPKKEVIGDVSEFIFFPRQRQ